MKRIAFVLAFAASLCGCAGTSPLFSASYQVDHDKVAAVERAATRQGVGLIWVNQPLKKQLAPSTGG